MVLCCGVCYAVFNFFGITLSRFIALISSLSQLCSLMVFLPSVSSLLLQVVGVCGSVLLSLEVRIGVC